MSTYDQILSYLYTQLPSFQKKGGKALKYKLDNIKNLCSKLNNPQEQYPIIHVGGTNGKGSVSHILASVFQEAGYKVGLYTSPHLKSFTERIKVNGNPISEDRVVQFVSDHQPLFEQIKPSFFEVTVAMAFEEFYHQQVDIAIVEVGLGGRLDSTNIITPILSVITNISLDHMQFLGDTVEKIAFEKAGIIKHTVPVVIGEKDEKTAPVFIEKARQEQAPIHFASEQEYPEYESDLKGEYQKKNRATALKAIALLQDDNITQQYIVEGLRNVIKNTGLKGRWQVLEKSPYTVCDTAHNEAGIKQITAQIAQHEYHKLWMIIGMVSDKDTETILQLLPKKAHYIFCQPKIDRALDATQLHEIAASVGLTGEVILDVNQAIKEVKSKSDKNDFIYIGGSTFVVAEIENL